MANHYSVTFEYNSLDTQAVNDAIEKCRILKNQKVLIEVPNTVGMNYVDILRLPDNVDIRVAGGYDKDMIARGQRRSNWEDRYYNSVIYTKNELSKILIVIDEIERGIYPNWSDIQKVVYIFERLRSFIMYDSEFEKQDYKDIRSLTCLLSRKAVCAGFANMFKEFMDRQGIKCAYTSGNGHAWNIVTINGKSYPVDVTWDNTNLRHGIHKPFTHLCKTPKEFAKSHKPYDDEPIQDYERTLSTLDREVVEEIYERIGSGRNRNYKSETNKVRLANGNKLHITQLDCEEIDGHEVFRYHFREEDINGFVVNENIYYGLVNVNKIIDSIRFKKEVSGERNALINIFLSDENMMDSRRRGTSFLGGIYRRDINGVMRLVPSVRDIKKTDKVCEMFRNKSKKISRSDGTNFIIEEVWNTPKICEGIPLRKYEIYESIPNNDGTKVLYKTTIYAEQDLINDTRREIADIFLSRHRLDRKVRESGGYLGFLDAYGTKRYHPNVAALYSPQRRIDFKENNIIKFRVNESRPYINYDRSVML